jgi:plasmid stabilization system protein ParE
MKYTVVWLQDAQEQLAEIHLTVRLSDEEARVNRAVNQIESDLARTAATAGESRGVLRRYLIRRPIAVSFEVHDDIVIVLEIRYWPAPAR